jgi:hypothetical protein
MAKRPAHVQYEANLKPGVLWDRFAYERVAIGQCHGRKVGVLVRFGKAVTRFVPGPAQLKKIESDKGGKVRITEKQIERAQTFCPRPGMPGWGW